MAIRDIYPLKDNQFISSWDCVSFHLNGNTKPLVGIIQDLNYKLNLNGADFVFGSSDGGLPIGRKHGKLNVSGSFTALDTFIKDLVKDWKDIGFFHKQFDFSVVSKDPDGTMNTTEFSKVNIIEIGTAFKQGETNLVSVSFQAFNCKINGDPLIIPVS